MLKLIKSQAPLRISFAGGGTDIDPFPEKYGGAVVSATINKYVSSTLRFRKDKKLNIEIVGEGKASYQNIERVKYGGEFDIIKIVIKYLYREKKGLDIFIYKDVRANSGLGSSAALFVSCIGLFNELLKKKLDKHEIAELAYKLEINELKNLGGKQDQYASVFGGLNFIEFKNKNLVKVSPLNLTKEILCELEDNLVLLDIGKRKSSGTILEDQIRNVKYNKETLAAMKKTKETAYQLKEALLAGNVRKFGLLIDKSWQLKKKFSNKISRTDIDLLYKNLKKAGALGGKISGAGGGGHMFVFCQPFTRDNVEKTAIEWGAKLVPFKFENDGLLTWKINF